MALLQIIRKPQLAKDKGYAWVILFFSFLSHFAHLGFSFSTAGNLTIAHQKVFNIDLQKGSLLGTIHIGVLLLFGKFVISTSSHRWKRIVVLVVYPFRITAKLITNLNLTPSYAFN